MARCIRIQYWSYWSTCHSPAKAVWLMYLMPFWSLRPDLWWTCFEFRLEDPGVYNIWQASDLWCSYWWHENKDARCDMISLRRSLEVVFREFCLGHDYRSALHFERSENWHHKDLLFEIGEGIAYLTLNRRWNEINEIKPAKCTMHSHHRTFGRHRFFRFRNVYFKVAASLHSTAHYMAVGWNYRSLCCVPISFTRPDVNNVFNASIAQALQDATCELHQRALTSLTHSIYFTHFTLNRVSLQKVFHCTSDLSFFHFLDLFWFDSVGPSNCKL